MSSASDSGRRPARIAVLASGGGSNLQALLDHLAGPAGGAGQVVWVGSDKAGCGALARAERAGAATHVVTDARDSGSLIETLDRVGADVLVLAGYLKLVPAAVVGAFRGRLLNVHPALLPAFGGPGMYGQRIHAAVLAHGAMITGVTVHFVDEEFDRGPIIAQWPVPVLPGDTPETLGARVLRVEHRLFPLCVAAVAAGTIVLGDDNQVHGHLGADLPLASPSWRFGLTPDTDFPAAAFGSEAGLLYPR